MKICSRSPFAIWNWNLVQYILNLAQKNPMSSSWPFGKEFSLWLHPWYRNKIIFLVIFSFQHFELASIRFYMTLVYQRTLKDKMSKSCWVRPNGTWKIEISVSRKCSILLGDDPPLIFWQHSATKKACCGACTKPYYSQKKLRHWACFCYYKLAEKAYFLLPLQGAILFLIFELKAIYMVFFALLCEQNLTLYWLLISGKRLEVSLGHSSNV